MLHRQELPVTKHLSGRGLKKVWKPKQHAQHNTNTTKPVAMWVITSVVFFQKYILYFLDNLIQERASEKMKINPFQGDPTGNSA